MNKRAREIEVDLENLTEQQQLVYNFLKRNATLYGVVVGLMIGFLGGFFAIMISTVLNG